MRDVIDPPTPTSADFQKRLINFETGKSKLRPEHETWLNELVSKTRSASNFTCHVYGFASKLGKHQSNVALSYDRANAVAGLLEKLDRRYTSRIDQFQAEGDEGYKAPLGDNDPVWRAVEVHVFLRSTPVPPKPNVLPVNPRTGLKWSVSGHSLGLTTNPIDWLPAQVALNMFAFRNDETYEVGKFLSPMFGVGYDLLELIRAILPELETKPAKIPLDKLMKLVAEKKWAAFFKELLKDLGLDLSWTPTDFQKATVFLPLTLRKLDGASISNASVNVGPVHQYQYLFVNGQTWYTERSGKRMFGMRDFLEVPASWGTQFQFPNLGGSFLGGPLLRL